jgi:hypothetical protein
MEVDNTDVYKWSSKAMLPDDLKSQISKYLSSSTTKHVDARRSNVQSLLLQFVFPVASTRLAPLKIPKSSFLKLNNNSHSIT